VPNGKSNIVALWGQDVALTNLSCSTDGLMGYRTPSIDLEPPVVAQARCL
jgi:hypothetical protein